jgi:hypothetical protein
MWKKTFVRLQDRAVAADIIANMHLESNLMKIASRVNDDCAEGRKPSALDQRAVKWNLSPFRSSPGP